MSETVNEAMARYDEAKPVERNATGSKITKDSATALIVGAAGTERITNERVVMHKGAR